jgi:hypothetical protein
VNRHGNLTRFLKLSDAVREHEKAANESDRPLRERDRALYETVERLRRSIPIRELH